VTAITAGQAKDGDAVLAPDGGIYQYLGDGVWGSIIPVGTMSGPLWQPEGELVLLARDGKPCT
jgi:hypothetical protein